jgi:hypothetical protein
MAAGAAGSDSDGNEGVSLVVVEVPLDDLPMSRVWEKTCRKGQAAYSGLVSANYGVSFSVVDLLTPPLS